MISPSSSRVDTADGAEWLAVADTITAADHVLTEAVLEKLIDLVRHLSRPPRAGEFLAPLGSDGDPVAVSGVCRAGICHAIGRDPGLGRWFSPAQHKGVDTVLVARSLCHRVGIRHRTVQLILDHPTQPDYTLIQIRSLDKVDSPGTFDLPCAGHVVGTSAVDTALRKELNEELGLTEVDLAALAYVGEYEYRDTTSRADFMNVELRSVYRARLRAERLRSIRFADGEVAALAVFSLDTLHDLVSRAPERVASGLLGALPWYCRQR